MHLSLQEPSRARFLSAAADILGPLAGVRGELTTELSTSLLDPRGGVHRSRSAGRRPASAADAPMRALGASNFLTEAEVAYEASQASQSVAARAQARRHRHRGRRPRDWREDREERGLAVPTSPYHA